MADDKGNAPETGEPATDSDATRLDRLEHQQAETQGLVRQILDRLPGGPEVDDRRSQPQGTNGEPPAQDIASQVRAEIEAAKKRQADADKAKADADSDASWRAGVDEQLEKLKPEQRPRQVTPGIRGRLQRAMFGEDSR